MKSIALSLCMVLVCLVNTAGQSNQTADKVIEGGKLVVELINALNNKKDVDKNPGCKGKYADLCVENELSNSITVILHRQLSEEKKEMVIQPAMKECSLQMTVGVWTYDLRLTSTSQSVRKGDLLIEGCQNLIMNIK